MLERRLLLVELNESGGRADVLVGEFLVFNENDDKKRRLVPSALRQWLGDEVYVSVNLPTPMIEQHSKHDMRETMRSIGQRYQTAFPEADIHWCDAPNCLFLEKLDQQFDQWYDELLKPKKPSSQFGW